MQVRTSVAHVSEVTESILNRNSSFAEIAVVQPVSVVEDAAVADETVGFADAVIVFDTVGLVPALNARFQMSKTIDPDWSPMMCHPVIVQANGTTSPPVIPVARVEPAPSAVCERPIVNVPDTWDISTVSPAMAPAGTGWPVTGIWLRDMTSVSSESDPLSHVTLTVVAVVPAEYELDEIDP